MTTARKNFIDPVSNIMPGNVKNTLYIPVVFTVLSALSVLLPQSGHPVLPCPHCGASQMMFSDDLWLCQNCNRTFDISLVVPEVLATRLFPQRFPEAYWSSAEQVQQTLCPPSSWLLHSGNQLILSCELIAQLVMRLQNNYRFQIPARRVNNALVLAQLTLLKLPHSRPEPGLLNLAERQYLLTSLVAYWTLWASGHQRMDAEQLLQPLHEYNFHVAELLPDLHLFINGDYPNDSVLSSLFESEGYLRMSTALANLRAMGPNSYKIYLSEFEEADYIAIYFVDNTYYILSPYNLVMRTVFPVKATRLLTNLAEDLTEDLTRFKSALNFFSGYAWGLIWGLPLAVAARILCNLDWFGTVTGAMSLAYLSGLYALVYGEGSSTTALLIEDDLDSR